jgi:hypothetical protein
VFSAQHQLSDVIGEPDSGFSDEVTNVLALLLWLAFDVDFNAARLNEIEKRHFNPDDFDDDWTIEAIIEATERILRLLPLLTRNEEAVRLLEKVFATSGDTDWWTTHHEWMENLTRRAQEVTEARQGESPRQGSIVQKIKKPDGLHVVSRVAGSVFFHDVSTGNERGYAKSFLTIVER